MFLAVEVSAGMQQPALISKALIYSFLFNQFMYIPVGIVTVAFWGGSVTDPVNLALSEVNRTTFETKASASVVFSLLMFTGITGDPVQSHPPVLHISRLCHRGSTGEQGIAAESSS